MQHVAFFGIGNMGFPMALNLIRAGYQVHIAPHRGHSDALRQLNICGACLHEDKYSMVSQADVIVSIVSDDMAVRDIFLNEDMRKAIPRGCIIIEMTTCSPDIVIELAEYYAQRNVHILDAPVTGAKQKAMEGTLTVMGAGDPADFQKADGVLHAMASKIFQLGELGNGKLVKAMTNLLGAINLAAVGEFYRFAESMHLDMNLLSEITHVSAGGSIQFSRNFEKIVSGNFSPAFSLKLMRKDMGIALSCANNIPDLHMPLAETAYGLYARASHLDEADCSAIACIDSLA